MNCRLSILVLWTSFLASVVPLRADEQPSRSGAYGSLALAVGEDGSVHGVFAEQRVGNGTVDAPQFSCLFLLEGHMDGARGEVETWFPGDDERVHGTLRLGEQASLQLEENHGGCLMTSGDMKDAPHDLLFDEPYAEWIGTGLVTAERAILYPDPIDTRGRKRPYLVAFDPVAVLTRRPGWIHVQYPESEGRPVTGWIREDAVALSAPPLP